MNAPETAVAPGAGELLGAPFVTRSGALLLLRHCRDSSDLDACVDLQRYTWGYADLEVTPSKSFMLAQELGGQVIAAFDHRAHRQQLVGFAMSMAALEPSPEPGTLPQPYLHSHMLAVLPEYRNQGLGARLKLAQRQDALARGITRMTWTFDPLAAKNAYLNIHRLGAIARRYSPDFYGVSSSRLQAGLPTDRLHAEWWLDSAHVHACAEAFANGAPPPARPAAAEQTIGLPAALEDWKQSETGIERVRVLQSSNRQLFLKAFASGLAVMGFRRDAEGNGMFELASRHPNG